jgi:hypothetical protein
MQYTHPLTGALYTLREDGLIDVDDRGRCGVFHGDGRHESGELTQADLHLLGWMTTKHLTRSSGRHPFFADARRHR